MGIKRYIDVRDGWILEVDDDRERWTNGVSTSSWSHPTSMAFRPYCVRLTELAELLYGVRK